MSISFIANDPGVKGAKAEVIQPSPERPASRATFAVAGLPPEQIYPADADEFVGWQAREAALRTLNVFEEIAGPIKGWTGKASKRRLDLRPNDGEDLNAYYDRRSVSFFEFPLGKRTVYSGASTDVVAHEVGHAILDALRPDLWDVQTTEVSAFHEGFGDCLAIMSALSDRATRVALVESDPTVAGSNFVEATAEELSVAIGKAVSPNHNAAKPRRARNTFQWALPQSLPLDGKPGVLINEIHSFGQLTSGCYYDLILTIFAAGGGGEAGLWRACETATRLLALAAAAAPIRPRFLETVGRTMILVDRQRHNGDNEAFIREAFEKHGLSLSVGSFLTPRAALTAPRGAGRRAAAPTPAKAGTVSLSAPVRQLLHAFLEVDAGARLEARPFAPSGGEASQVVSHRPVDLSGLSKGLENVRCYTPVSALVGSAGGTMALLGAVDPAAVVSSEVRSFVGTLVARDLIAFDGEGDGTGRRRGRRSGRAAGFVASKSQPTHTLRTIGQEVVLERMGFACGCVRRPLACVSA